MEKLIYLFGGLILLYANIGLFVLALTGKKSELKKNLKIWFFTPWKNLQLE